MCEVTILKCKVPSVRPQSCNHVQQVLDGYLNIKIITSTHVHQSTTEAMHVG